MALSGAGHGFDIADLAAEGFDPRFTARDLAVHRRQAPPPADVAAEQARIDRADARTYARHGYSGAMKTQIDHGIFDYCGARVVTSELLLDSETQDPAPHLDAARAIGRDLFDAAKRCEAAGMSA